MSKKEYAINLFTEKNKFLIGNYRKKLEDF